MNRRVTVEELREHLEEHLEHVRQGDTLTVVRDGKVLANLEQEEKSWSKKPDPALGRFQDVDVGPAPENLTVDVVDLLRQMRDEERY